MSVSEAAKGAGEDFLQLWIEMSRKYLGKDKCIFRGVVQDSICDVTAHYWHDVIGSGVMTCFEQLKRH